jgi:phospholipase C
MPNELKDRVKTLVIVMKENRSFDHMLGYLSLKDGAKRGEINGIDDPLDDRFANISLGKRYAPFPMADHELPSDLPHGRDLVQVQLAKSSVTGQYTMRGFVEAYREAGSATNIVNPEPMGFLQADGVPMMDFLAEHFAVCNRWHAPLPADTQPNRMMALSGFTTVDNTKFQPIDQKLIYHWLDEQKTIRWRVYRSGIPFCILLPNMWSLMLGDNFRPIEQLSRDVQYEPDSTFPQVIFVEPSYGDAPIHIPYPPNDDHPPMPVGPGQEFLRYIYDALTANRSTTGKPDRWANTLLIVTYDEHGGFYDHEIPLPIRTDPPQGASYRPFESTGVRVPALLVSPWVKARSVYNGTLDHTSILQLVNELFGDGTPNYNQSVKDRRDAGIKSVSEALLSPDIAVTSARTDVPISPEAPFTSHATFATVDPTQSILARSPKHTAFGEAITALLEKKSKAALAKHPELAHWDMVTNQ